METMVMLVWFALIGCLNIYFQPETVEGDKVLV